MRWLWYPPNNPDNGGKSVKGDRGGIGEDRQPVQPITPGEIPTLPQGALGVVPTILGQAPAKFEDNFETGGLESWINCQSEGVNGNCSGANPGRAAAIQGGAREGNHAAHFQVHDGDDPPGESLKGERSEARAPGAVDATDGQRRWYQFSMYLPPEFRNPDGGWFIVMQWHAGDGSPPLALQITNEGVLELSNNRTNQATNLGPIQRGRWVDYTLYVDFSPSAGVAKAWADGAELGVHRAPNMASDSNYLKMGIYRDPDTTGTHHVFFDNVIISEPK